MKMFFAQLRLWLRKITKPFRSFILWVLLDVKQKEAIWRQATTGVTHYVIVMSWYQVRCMDKKKYDYVRKYLIKKYGKDIARHVKWRATGTLQRNENYCPAVEHVN